MPGGLRSKTAQLRRTAPSKKVERVVLIPRSCLKTASVPPGARKQVTWNDDHNAFYSTYGRSEYPSSERHLSLRCCGAMQSHEDWCRSMAASVREGYADRKVIHPSARGGVCQPWHDRCETPCDGRSACDRPIADEHNLITLVNEQFDRVHGAISGHSL